MEIGDSLEAHLASSLAYTVTNCKEPSLNKGEGKTDTQDCSPTST